VASPGPPPFPASTAGRPVGLVELTVVADRVDHLADSLEDRGWTTHR
jgi:hypothetical protein